MSCLFQRYLPFKGECCHPVTDPPLGAYDKQGSTQQLWDCERFLSIPAKPRIPSIGEGEEGEEGSEAILSVIWA